MTYSSLLEAAIAAVDFHSPTVFSWFGRLSEDVHPHVRRSLSVQSARSYLHYHLKMRLYKDFYCQGVPSPTGPELKTPPARRTSLAQKLSQANQGQGYWSHQWQPICDHLRTETLRVRRRGLTIQVKPQEYKIRTSASGDTQASIRFPKEFWGMSPGHYMALSDRELVPESLADLVRIYWNVTSEGAVPLMYALTASLNSAGLPFRFKVLNDPARFNRCDAAVLYIHRADFQAIFQLIQLDIYPQMASLLEHKIPAFTKRLGAGVGLAEEPGNGESFGLDRCHKIAEGLILANEAGQTEVSDRLSTLLTHFNEAGLSLETPYLQQSRAEDYEVPLLQSPNTQDIQAVEVSTSSESRVRFLNAAEGIAQRICRDAIWHNGQCNWLGAEATNLDRATTLSMLTHRALGPELYDGTSGIALFLAELSQHSGLPELKETAIGAIRHAVAHLDQCQPIARRGFYSGWLGIAVAAARMGTLFKHAELINSAQVILKKLDHPSLLSPHFDLVSGLAGGIQGLMILRELLPNQEDCLALAKRWSEELIALGQYYQQGYAWTEQTKALPLTGWSHGTSGVAASLLSLHRFTPDDRLRKVAEDALAYERQWFDAEQRNWPDLRQVKRGQHHLPFMSAWCHGAPGIALARVQAAVSLGHETYYDEAIAALTTTRQALMAGLNQERQANFSLCHGLAGNADILLACSQQLGYEVPEHQALVEAIADMGIRNYAENQQWPCGIHSRGETPNLMLGYSGTGYFYLRLFAHSIPSVLDLQNQAFQTPRQNSHAKTKSSKLNRTAA